MCIPQTTFYFKKLLKGVRTDFFKKRPADLQVGPQQVVTCTFRIRIIHQLNVIFLKRVALMLIKVINRIPIWQVAGNLAA